MRRLPKAFRCIIPAILISTSLAYGAPDASLNHGILQLRDGSPAEAVATLQQLVGEHPDNVTFQYWLGRAHLAAGDLPAAGQMLSAVTDRAPSSASAHHWLGIARMRSAKYAQARTQFRRALDCDPQFQPARNALQELTSTISALAAGRRPFAPRTHNPGHRIAIHTGDMGIDIGTIDLRSYNVADYTFSDAPTDWFARGGTWAITNRWTCQPQWSWMGGYAEDGVAAMWNKREFVGDVTVEAYMAFKMGLGNTHQYKNPTNLNVTIHGDGANPSSGYSFMVGADKNQDTRIMKGTEILASTADTEAILPIFEDQYPSAYEFHRKWWGIRARKCEGKLQLYLDNKLVLETEDPDPLDSGRVAIWTHDNGIIISRIKIYYSGERSDRTPVPGEQSLTRTKVDTSKPSFHVTSDTHPGMFRDFEPPLPDWGNARRRPRTERLLQELAALPEPADPAPLEGNEPLLRVVERDGDGPGHCLAVTNTMSGGTFMLPVLEGDLDLARHQHLSFDYRLPENDPVRVNFYATAGGHDYEIRFCGPEYTSPRATRIGTIANIREDGEWHHATFDLLAALQQQGIDTKTIKLQDLRIGNLCDHNYLWAGFGGNHFGATYYLDNMALDTPGGGKAKLAFHPTAGTDINGYSLLVDDHPNTEAPTEVSTTEASTELELQTSGTKYAHIRAKTTEGNWSPTEHYQLRVDTEPPEFAKITPGSGEPLSDAPVQIALYEPGGSGVAIDSIALSLNGADLSVADSAVSYDPQQHVISVDPRIALGDPADGMDVALALNGMADRAGNEMPTAHQWAYTVAFDTDRTPPTVPGVQIGPAEEQMWADFENSLGGFTTYGGSHGGQLSLDTSTAASGNASLRVHNPIQGGRYGIVRRTDFDASKYRIVSFDYKVPPRLRADIAVYVNGDMKGIKFMDNDNNIGLIGAVPDVVADNQWHHAEFNLYDMLRKDDPAAASYLVRQFVIADWQWKANAEGQTYHLDNFRIIPVHSGTHGLRLACNALDISGIDGLAWAIGDIPATDDPDRVDINGRSGVTDPLPSTNGWLCVRARDGAGNWSEHHCARVLIDSEPPEAQILTPRDGEATAEPTVTVRLSDAGPAGIAPDSVVLAVNQQEYRLDPKQHSGLSFDGKTNQLVWDCEKVKPNPIVFEDQQEVTVALKSAADCAGNPATNLPKTSWRMDYSLDTRGPEVSVLESNTHRTFLTCTFENGLQEWRNRAGEDGAKVELDNSTAASGQASVKLTQQKDGGRMSAYVTTQAFSVDRYPIISFDYKIPAGVKLDLLVHKTDGKDVAIAITDNPTGAVARVPGIRADNEWHHASVNLGRIVRKMKERGSLQIDYIYLSDRNKLENEKGAAAWFDNFIIGSVGAREPVMRWMATDPTDVVAYSYEFDRDPGTVPDEVSEGQARSWRHENDLEKGRWYFHIRAQDGAGNWGPTRHYALMHRTAE